MEAAVEFTPTQGSAVFSTLKELGDTVCVALDRLLFESPEGATSLTELDPGVLEALECACLIRRDEQGTDWIDAQTARALPEILGDTISSMSDSGDHASMSLRNIRSIERRLRRAIRSRAISEWGRGGWRQELLEGELRDRTLERAGRALYPRAENVAHLRDPLEWLELSELLDIRPTLGNLGLSDRMWRELSSDLLPLTERARRALLLDANDAATAARWENITAKRLTTSGAVDLERASVGMPPNQLEILKSMQGTLTENVDYNSEVAKCFDLLALTTLKFLAHTLDVPSALTRHSDEESLPLESQLQNAYRTFLDQSPLPAHIGIEQQHIGGGRVDVALLFAHGTRFVTEVKRETSACDREAIEKKYLAQTTAYQASNVRLGQLLILDLTIGRSPASEALAESVWVSHTRDADGYVISSTLVAVVRANRKSPSQR